MKTIIFALTLAGAAVAQSVNGASSVPAYSAGSSSAQASSSSDGSSSATASSSGGYSQPAYTSSASSSAQAPQYTQPPSQQYGGGAYSASYDGGYYSSFMNGGYKSMQCGYGYNKGSDGGCQPASWYTGGGAKGCYQTTIINNNGGYGYGGSCDTKTVTETQYKTMTEVRVSNFSHHIIYTHFSSRPRQRLRLSPRRRLRRRSGPILSRSLEPRS